MKIRVWRGKDKSKSAPVDRKVPVTEMKGVPVRVTTFPQANGASRAEAVVILTRGCIRSVVARAGEMDLYLSPRAEFRCIEPEPPETRPADEPLTLCAACREGKHENCDNNGFEDLEDQWCECASCYVTEPARGGQ